MKGMMLGIVAGLAMLILGVGVWGARSASADNGPHVAGQGMTTDACAGCHRAHTARGAYLLRVDEEALCETCHDGTEADTNVVNGKLEGVTVAAGNAFALKAGGFDTAYIKADDQTWRFRNSTACSPTTLERNNFGSGSSNTPTTPACTIPAVTQAQMTGDGVSTGLWHIYAQTTPEATTSHHSIDAVADTVWGNGAIGSGAGGSLTLGCAKCHDPHGNGNYRILRKTPAADAGAAGVTDRNAAGIVIPDTFGHDYTTLNYLDTTYVKQTTATQAVANTPPVFSEDGLSAWCSQCHSRYLAYSQYDEDSGDAIFTYRHSTAASSATGLTSPVCNKCHVAHGTNAAAGGLTDLVGWPGAVDAGNFADPPGSGGGSRLLKMDNRGMCLKCHKR